jgi:hypothetical protein
MTDATPRSRWYRITPGRFLPLLLAVEGLLWLSEHFRWFAFNEHKGYAVLIAVATVGVFFLLMLLWFLLALLFRWRFQFSILSLLVLTVAVALPFAWLAAEMEQAGKQRAAVMKRARKQRDAAEAIEKAGGTVIFDYELDPLRRTLPNATLPGPAWLQGLLADETFATVALVYLDDREFSDAVLEHLAGLTELQRLDLAHTKVSDAGLEHLRGLTQLQYLRLDGTKVGDAGMEHLKGLIRLGDLELYGTMVSDAGLEHLKGLSQLERLDLRGTAVTDEGATKVRKALPNCNVVY